MIGRGPGPARTRGRRTLAAAALAVGLLFPPAGPARAAPGVPAQNTVEHIRGIYLQRAIEIATVGTRTVRLTRMTRFRRCGRFRGLAQDFNEHLVDVAGREVEGIGFVAGYVDTIEGCPPAGDGPRGSPVDAGGGRYPASALRTRVSLRGYLIYARAARP